MLARVDGDSIYYGQYKKRTTSSRQTPAAPFPEALPQHRESLREIVPIPVTFLGIEAPLPTRHNP